jgi:hypothetical protein
MGSASLTRLAAGEVGSGAQNQTEGQVMSDLAIMTVVATAAILAAVALWRIHIHRQQVLEDEHSLGRLRSSQARPNPDRRRRA